MGRMTPIFFIYHFNFLYVGIIMTKVYHDRSDEIDLLELFKLLWDKKRWIILSIFICTAIAGVYAFSAKEQWTSSAEVIPPKGADITDYIDIQKEYGRIANINYPLDSQLKTLFSNFQILAESSDIREQFFHQSEFYKKLSEGKDDKTQREILVGLANKLIITKPKPSKNSVLQGIKISFSADSPLDAQKVLTEFIAFVNQAAYQTELGNFLFDVNQKILDLNYEKVTIERDLSSQRVVQINQLQNALNIAKRSGTQDYIPLLASNNGVAVQIGSLNDKNSAPSIINNEFYLFMLGQKYLQAQLDVLTESNMIYPPRYYQINTILNELNSLAEKAKETKAVAVAYQSSPNYSIYHSWPKRTILLLVGALLGAIWGIGLVLITHLLKARKQQ